VLLDVRIQVLKGLRRTAAVFSTRLHMKAMQMFHLKTRAKRPGQPKKLLHWALITLCVFFLNLHALAQPAIPSPSMAQFGPYKFNANTQLDYQINGQSHGLHYNAKAQITWRTTGSRYNAAFEIQMPLFFGTRTQRSEGLMSEEGLKPLVFTDQHRKTQTAVIDPENNLIKLADNTSTVPLQKFHQDALSVFFQVGGLLAGLAEPYPFTSTLKLPVLMAQTNEQWTFRLDSKDTLKLPFGEVVALKIFRLPRSPGDKQKFSLWLSPSLGFLPVRLLIEEENQDTVDQRLVSLRTPPSP